VRRPPADGTVFAGSLVGGCAGASSRGRASATWVLAAACAVASLLAACGQKGPLFLPATQGAAAKAPAHVPSAPDDRAQPSLVPPMPSDTKAPSGVVPAK
jgi:predicted small lipoprotein YifL